MDWDMINLSSIGPYHSLFPIVDLQYFFWSLIIDDTWNLMPQAGGNKLQWEMLSSICSHEEFAWGQSLLKQLLSLPTNCFFICCTCNHDMAVTVAPTDSVSALLYQLLWFIAVVPTASVSAVPTIKCCCMYQLWSDAVPTATVPSILCWYWCWAEYESRHAKDWNKNLSRLSPAKHLEVLTSCWTTLAALIHRVKNVQFHYKSVTGGTSARCLATPSTPFLIEGY